jgi:hypothetical protein
MLEIELDHQLLRSSAPRGATARDDDDDDDDVPVTSPCRGEWKIANNLTLNAGLRFDQMVGSRRLKTHPQLCNCASGNDERCIGSI